MKSHHVASAIRDILNTNKSDDLKLKAVAAMLLSATSGMRAEEIYQLRFEDIDIDNRIIHIKAEIAKDYEDRITFFSEEAKEWLLKYLSMNPDPDKLFAKSSLKHVWTLISVKIGNIPFRLKHCRKFFSQQSDRLGMPTAIKKILMGHVVSDEEFVIPRGSDVDLSHYDFQDEEELRKIYDRYWRDFRILE
ncbi:site-specific integrase [Archaeoglobus sp.]